MPSSGTVLPVSCPYIASEPKSHRPQVQKARNLASLEFSRGCGNKNRVLRHGIENIVRNLRYSRLLRLLHYGLPLLATEAYSSSQPQQVRS